MESTAERDVILFTEKPYTFDLSDKLKCIYLKNYFLPRLNDELLLKFIEIHSLQWGEIRDSTPIKYVKQLQLHPSVVYEKEYITLEPVRLRSENFRSQSPSARIRASGRSISPQHRAIRMAVSPTRRRRIVAPRNGTIQQRALSPKRK